MTTATSQSFQDAINNKARSMAREEYLEMRKIIEKHPLLKSLQIITPTRRWSLANAFPEYLPAPPDITNINSLFEERTQEIAANETVKVLANIEQLNWILKNQIQE